MEDERKKLIAIECAMDSILSTLKQAGHTQIFPSHLGAFLRIPKLSTIDFAFNADASKTGTLSVTASQHLVHAAKSLGSVFAVTSSFRGDQDPEPLQGIGSKWLFETRLIQAMAPGTISDAENLHYSIILNAIKALCEYPDLLESREKERLLRVTAPFRKYTFAEIRQILGGEKDHDFSISDRLRISEMSDDLPVFITNFPASVEPRYTMFNVHKPGGVLEKYDLVVPYGTETGAGGVYETKLNALQKNIKGSSYTGELVGLGGSADGLNVFAQDLSRLKNYFWINIGFERFMQFLLAEDDIDRVAFFPSSARTLFQSGK